MTVNLYSGTLGDKRDNRGQSLFVTLSPIRHKNNRILVTKGTHTFRVCPIVPTVCWRVPSPQNFGHVASLGFGNALALAAVGKLHQWLGMAIFWGGVGDWLAGRGIRWQSFVLFNVLG